MLYLAVLVHFLKAAGTRGLLDPPTLQCLTGRADGGRHLYFRHPGFHVGNRKLAPKLDVRADDGYVVLPPSVHPNGVVYRWVDTFADVRKLPASVRDELEKLQQDEPAPPLVLGSYDVGDIDRRARAYLRRVGVRGEGERNNTAFRVAAFLVNDVAMDDATAWAYLVEWNAGNTPPLGERELRGRLTSAKKHAKRARGSGLVRAPRFLDPFARSLVAKAWL